MPWCSESCSADSTIYFNQDRGEMGVDVSPSFQSSTFRCKGVLSLSPSLLLSLLFSPSLFFCSFTLYYTHTHTPHKLTHDQVEEWLLWVTRSDKVLSWWAILIYVNKPCHLCERQKGPQMSLGNLSTFAARKRHKENTLAHTLKETHTYTVEKREGRYWTVERDTNTVVKNDDKFSCTKTCFL